MIKAARGLRASRDDGSASSLVASEAAAAFAHIRSFSLYKLDKKRIEKERNEKVANFQEWQFMQSEKLVMRQHRLSNA